MEERSVGGVPIVLWVTRKLLPKNKMKREFVYKIRMIIFTYFIYALFNMTRRPIAVIKTRIIDECKSSGNETSETQNWCEEIKNFKSPEAAMGFLDFLLIASYALCEYVSGVVADCFNPRYYLTAGCFFTGYICALMGLTNYWNILSFKFKVTLMILFGASQSTAWPVVLSSVTHWYGVVGRRRGMFYGFWNTHNYVGSILGISIARIWVDRNFMWSFFVPGFIIAVAGVLVFVEMVVDPKDLKELDRQYSTSSLSRSRSLNRTLGSEVPSWLSSDTSITFYDALTLPGVIEFSISLFFSRMVGYTFLFWLPVFMQKTNVRTASYAAYYFLFYVLGGSIGGILAGIFSDITKRTAIVCTLFLVLSIPILLLGILLDLGRNLKVDFPLFLVMGILVEAPFVVISTSVSADLGTHKLIKRNYRALSTVGGIIEGTGALGASIGTYFCGLILVNAEWKYIFYTMAACQFLAVLSLSRQAYKEIYRKQLKEDEMEEISSYLKLPSFN